jgi:transcriptional regulator with PAS, ATPase and Fis domain
VVDSETTIEASCEAERSEVPQAYLVVLGTELPEVVDLPLACPFSIGRSHSSGLRIRDGSVSRLHATFQWNGGQTVSIVDRGSRNGSWVNGVRIREPVELTSGSEIALGDVRIVVAVREGAHLGQDDATTARPGRTPFVVRDRAMLRVMALTERAARTKATILVLGETGVGKELVARTIHERSPRSKKPFVSVNCGAIPESLAESSLFGHERGAFTGASKRHQGFFEQADGGTLLLDEVGELSAQMQVRLLRALQEGEITRVGSVKPVRVEVRVVAATNADLEQKLRSGEFREDLFYRLDVMRIEIPPLRERPADIAPLAKHFIRELSPESPVCLSSAAIAALLEHPWPGNVRELRNVIERSLAVCDRGVLSPGDLVGLAAAPEGEGLRTTIDDAERIAIVKALEAHAGNQTRAAKQLGISRRSLIYKMERFELKPPPASRQGGSGQGPKGGT